MVSVSRVSQGRHERSQPAGRSAETMISVTSRSERYRPQDGASSSSGRSLTVLGTERHRPEDDRTLEVLRSEDGGSPSSIRNPPSPSRRLPTVIMVIFCV